MNLAQKNTNTNRGSRDCLNESWFMMPKTATTCLSNSISHSNMEILCTTTLYSHPSSSTPLFHAKHTVPKKENSLLTQKYFYPCSCYACTNSLNAKLFSPFSASYFIVMGDTYPDCLRVAFWNSKRSYKILGCLEGGVYVLVLANGAWNDPDRSPASCTTISQTPLPLWLT
jgi:hypothetical protein